MTALLASSFVIGREGLEAWLIAMLAIASANGNKASIKAIWYAVITAITATILLGSTTLQLLGSHANTERFEAFIGVFTGVVLAWVAWFCHGASQHLKNLPFHNVWLLGLVVFAVLFREGIEVILFMSAIMVNTKDTIMVSLGSLIGLVFLVAVGVISHRQIKKIPIGKIFKTSRWIFGALAVYFLYTGITELLEYSF